MRMAAVHPLTLLCCCVLATTPAAPASAATSIVTTGYNLSFFANGTVSSFTVDTGGATVQQLVAQQPSPVAQPPLVSVVMGPQYSNVVVGPSQLVLVTVGSSSTQDQFLRATFATPAGNISAAIRVVAGAPNSEFVRFTVASVTPSVLWDAAVARLRFVALPLRFELRGCATLAGIGYSANVAVVLLPGMLNVSVGGMPRTRDAFDIRIGSGSGNPGGAGCSLSASAFGDSGFVNASVTLWAGPRAALPAAVQLGERALGLPSPQLGGGGKLSPQTALEVAKGYFLIDIPPPQFNKTVEYAHAAGFGYIVLLDSWMATNPGQETMYGHYNVSEAWAKWGGGTGSPVAGLRAAVQFANAHGIKIGLHTMSGNIAMTDSYVTPIPDPRLATLPGQWTLAIALDVNATVARLSGNTTCLATVPLSERCTVTNCAPCPGAATHDIWIGDELMRYATLNSSTNILSSLVRGLHGTRAQSHSAGERVRVMAASPFYLPTGTLLDEIGANIARAVDAVGADTAYFDGLGAVLPVVSGGATERFACSRLQLAFWRSCKRQVIAQADTEGEPELESGHLWHMDSRSGQSDFAATDSKAFMDGMKQFSVRRAMRELFTPDLGW
jgi:hypothetical protein